MKLNCTIAGLFLLLTIGNFIPIASAQSSTPEVQTPTETSALDLYQAAGYRADLGDYKGAIEIYTRALEINPNFVLAYINRGVARARSDDLKGAEADFRSAIQYGPDYSLAYYNLGVLSLTLDKYKTAISYLTRAIQINRNWGEGGVSNAYASRGMVRFQLKDRSGAMADFNQAVAMNPRSSFAYTSRGIMYIQLGQYQVALADLERAIRLNDNWGVMDLATAHKYRGLAFNQLGNSRRAVQNFQRAGVLYQRRRDRSEYLNLLSQIYVLQNKDVRIPVDLPCYVITPSGKFSDLSGLCSGQSF